MWRFLPLCLLGACGFQISIGSAPGDDQPPIDGDIDTVIDSEPPHWLLGYTHRKRITVSSGSSVTLDDFVVAIVIQEDPDLAAHARDDGQDLTITTADDTILDYELERFDGQTGATSMWVRVPSLASQQTLYLYYGGELRQHDARETWSPLTFRAVWHMTDSVGTFARDSAGDHDLASSGAMNLPVLQDGIAGMGRGFDGINDMLRDDQDDNSLDFGTSSFSYSVWAYIVNSAGSFDMPMFKGGASAGQEGYDMELGQDNWSMYIGDGTTNRAVTVGVETLNAWVNVTIVVDRANQFLRGFKDGVEIQKLDISDINSISSNDRFTIGSSGTSYFLRGRVDEARIYPRALSAEWIAAEHATLRTPSTFANVGPEEASP